MLKTEDRFAPRHKKQDLNPEFGAEAQGEESRRGRRRSQTPEQVVRIEEAKAECGRDAWLCRFADQIGADAGRDEVEGNGITGRMPVAQSGGQDRDVLQERRAACTWRWGVSGWRVRGKAVGCSGERRGLGRRANRP